MRANGVAEKKYKVVIELTAKEIELLSYGWRSYYSGGEQLDFKIPLKPREDRRDGWYAKADEMRKLINKLPSLIFTSVSEAKIQRVEKELNKLKEGK